MLAPDPAVPHRDALLDGAGGVRRPLGGRTQRARPRQVPGRRQPAGRVPHRHGGRTSPAAPSPRAQPRTPRARRRPAGRAPVLHLPELDAVFWTFPNDRRLAAAAAARRPPGALDRLVGAPVAATRLVAYAAERSATAECLERAGRVLAYAKVLAGTAPRASSPMPRPRAPRRRGDPDLRLPRVLGASRRRGARARAAGRAARSTRSPTDGAGRAARARRGARRAAPRPRRCRAALRPPRRRPARAGRRRDRPRPAGRPARAAALLAALLAGRADARRPAGPPARRRQPAQRAARRHRVALIDLEHAAAGPGRRRPRPGARGTARARAGAHRRGASGARRALLAAMPSRAGAGPRAALVHRRDDARPLRAAGRQPRARRRAAPPRGRCCAAAEALRVSPRCSSTASTRSASAT